MSFRSFPIPERDAGPVIEVGGVRLQCVPGIPVKVLAEWDEERRFSYSAALVKVIRAMVIDDDQEVLDELLTDKDAPLDVQQLDQIIGWLFAEYTSRPTKPSSDSSPGVTPTPGGSTDGSASPSAPTSQPVGSTPNAS